ncbi:MAG: nuclear transport factor 2 family protein [Firmicutes bacterium]|nr:nuclear transport factor 2 family protein [Bacillota bacterium]
MSSSASAEVLRQQAQRYYTAVDAQDLPTLFSLFTEDIIYERPGYPALKGKAAFEHFYRNQRIIADGHHVLTHMICEAPYLVVEGEFHGTLKDGTPSTTRFVDVFTAQGDQFSRRHTYFDGQNV